MNGAAGRKNCMVGIMGSAIPGEGPAENAVAEYWPAAKGFLGKIENSVLGEGTLIDRYGNESGTYVSPAGTPAPMRALRPGTLEKSYNAYRVTQPISVMTGRVAPAFGQIGLGVQHVLPDTVENLINGGYLERIGR